jgi:hypothetical protein
MASRATIESAASSAWRCFRDFVVPCYYFVSGPVNKGTVECIMRPVPSRVVDGVEVKVGDSVVFIPAVQMAAVSMPAVGDYLLTPDGVKRWNVLAGQLNGSQTLMVLVVRRIY